MKFPAIRFLVTVAAAVMTAAVQGASAQAILDPFDCARAGFATGTPASTATCGWLTLPQDTAKPDSGHVVRLAVAVVHPTGTTRSEDPIVYLSGGPGAAAIQDAAALAQVAFGDALKTRDLVVVDPRGVGLSEPSLGCPEVQSFATDADVPSLSDDAYETAFMKILGSCVERLRTTEGIDLSTYTSAQSGADIMEVLHALGYHRANLYGLSYGSRLALTMIRDFGGTGEIRSAVLGGVYGPEANALQVPVGLAERLDLLFDACAADASCNAQYGDLRANLHAQLSRPERTAILEGLLDALGSTDGISGVPALLAAAAHGEDSLVSAGMKARQQELASLAWGMNVAVQCQEEFPLIPAEEQSAVAAAVRPGFEGLALRFPESSSAMPAWCAEHNFAARPEYENAPVSSDSVPVLAMSGRFDPFTPPEWADRATAGIAMRYLVTLEAAGHDTALASACSVGIVSAFIEDPNRSPDAGCANEAARFSSQ
jgi:pimeloyl-ACP methyl ester carboxylesterase